MSVEYRLLGPLEVLVDGRPVELGPPRHRCLLVLLLTQANAVVPAHQIVDELWGDAPPASAVNLVQGAVSALRKVLGREAIATGAGGTPSGSPRALDLQRFERLAQGAWRSTTAGSTTLRARSAKRSRSGAARRSPTSRTSCSFRRSRPGSTSSDCWPSSATSRRSSASAGTRTCSRGSAHSSGTTPARAPTRSADARAVPLRAPGGRARGLPLGAGHAGRGARDLAGARPAGARGTHPAPGSRPPAARAGRTAIAVAAEEPLRSILVTPLAPKSVDSLLALAEPLARQPRREIVVVGTVTHGDELAGLSDALQARRAELVERGLATRAAAFTSMTPGADLARLAIEHDVDLLLVDAPGGLLEDARVLTLLDQAPSDVAIVAAPSGGAVTRAVERVLVPFGGAVHDWAAVEVGAWLARNTSSSLRLLGASEGTQGRDASRLLADASLAVQHAFGVPAEPLLVEPDAEALLAAASDAGAVVVGLTERWRREGLGAARTALATRASAPTALVRRGIAPVGSRRGEPRPTSPGRSRPSAPQANLHRTSSGRRHRRRVTRRCRVQITGGLEMLRMRVVRMALAAACVTALVVAVPAAGKTYRVSGKQITVDADAGISKMRGGLIGDWRGTSFEELGRSPLYHARGTELFKGCIDRRRDRSCKGDPSGTLEMTFEYWGLFASPDPASLVWGACSTRSSRARATSRARRASSRWSTRPRPAASTRTTSAT